MMRIHMQNKRLHFISLFMIAGFFSLFIWIHPGLADASSQDEEMTWIVRWEQSPPAHFYATSEVVDDNPFLNITVAKPKSGADAAEWVRDWESSSYVKYIQPNQKLKVSAVPNDPLFASQDYLQTIGAVEAWKHRTGNKDITIAVVDTGIDLEHSDLSERLIDGVNLLDPGSPPMDDHGHGTNIAGIIAAAANNNRGIAGILWDARIMPIKALGSDGMGDEYKLGEGILHAVDNGADIVLLSLGLHHYSPYLHEIIEYAEENGVLLIAAVGNEGNAVKYPAAYPTVLAVGGVNADREVASASNYGPEVDVVAPWQVFTTRLGGEYGTIEGTSMAAPQAAAAAALIWAQYPSFEPYQIRNLIRQSALDIGAPGWDEHSGYGLLQIDRALTMEYADDMFEPNNSQSEAARLSVSSEMIGVISTGQDEDWFWLANRYPGQVTINIETLDDQDVNKLQLLYADSEGNTRTFNDLSQEVIVPVMDQKAYLAVQMKQKDAKESIPYRIITSFSMNPDPFEDNDAQYKAYVLPTRDQTIRGTFHQFEDDDWFVMYLEQEGTMKIRAYTDTNRIDLELLLQQGNKNPIRIDWGADGESEYSGPIEVGPGKFYIRVKNYHPHPVSGYYFLNVEYKQAFQDPNEPNDRPFQATPVLDDVIYQGVIDAEQDEDWFIFTVEKDSSVNINLTDIPKDRMMSLRLYDSGQKQISTDVNMLGYDKIEIERDLEPGKYYIRLSANQPFNYQMYQLEVQVHELVAGLKDISGHWAEEWIVDMKEKNLMNGYDGNYFFPEKVITRAEAAVVLGRLVSPGDAPDPGFVDLPRDHWAFGDIARVTNAGIFTGYPDGSFQPSRPLTRVEMTVLMAQLLDVPINPHPEQSPFTDLAHDHWAFPYVIYMKNAGWITGYPDGQFRPNQTATRAEFASFVSRVVNR